MESLTDFGATLEALLSHDNNAIEWAGFGYATKGKLSLVAQVPGVENLYVFECETVEREGSINHGYSIRLC